MRVSNQKGDDSLLPIQISNNVPPFVNFDQKKRYSEIREQSQSNGTRFNDEESGQVNQMRNTNFKIAAKYTDYFEKDSSINNGKMNQKPISNFITIPFDQYQEAKEKEYALDTDGGTAQYIIDQRFITAK